MSALRDSEKDTTSGDRLRFETVLILFSSIRQSGARLTSPNCVVSVPSSGTNECSLGEQMKKQLVLCLIAIVVAACGDVRSQREGEVTDVVRNSHNEVSIRVIQAPTGDGDRVLFRLQGYHEAKDRFIQMALSRAQAQGELSEIFWDPKAEEKDRQVIALGLRQSVQRKLERIQNEFSREYSYLTAFAEGVNQYIDEMVARSTSDPNSPERRTLDFFRDSSRSNNKTYVPRKWEPRDSIAIFQGVTFYLSSTLQNKLELGELAFKEIERNLTLKDRTKLLLGRRHEDPSQIPATIPKLLDMRPIYPTFILDADPKQNPYRILPARKAPAPRAPALIVSSNEPKVRVEYECKEMGWPIPECSKNRAISIGSNSAVVDASMTPDGAVRLMNDTHLQLPVPMTLYVVTLDSMPAADPTVPTQGFKGRGLHIPGIPGWLIGHNENIGWGLTNYGAPSDDVRLEKLTPDGKRVLFARDGKMQEIPIQTETVYLQRRQRDGSVKQVPVEYRWLPHHGPVVSDGIAELQTMVEGAGRHFHGSDKMVATYAWMGHEASWTDLEGRRARGTEVVAQLRLDRARDFEEFKAAIDNIGGGAQNIVYADRQGNIGYYAYGVFPERKYAAEWSPMYPVMGQGKFEWEPRAREQIPELYNPTSGRIVTANNDPFGISENPVGEDYLGVFSTGSRAARLTKLLDEKRGQLDETEMKKIQFDHVDNTVFAFTELLRTRCAGAIDSSSPEYALYRDLSIFIGDMDRNANMPVLADTWLKHLQNVFIERSFEEPLQETLLKFRHKVEIATTLYHRLAEGEDGFVREIFLESLRRADAEIQDKDLRSLRWGDKHKLVLANPLAPLTAAVFTLNQPRDGYYETIDVAPPGMGIGPNFRMILTLKKDRPIEGLLSLPGGNFDLRDRTSFYQAFADWLTGIYRKW